MIWNRPFGRSSADLGDVPLVGGRGDARARDGKRVGADDSAANDVGLLLGRAGRARTHPAAARRAKRRIFTVEPTNLTQEKLLDHAGRVNLCADEQNAEQGGEV